MESEYHPATGLVQWTYDPNGNLATLIDPNGGIAHFQYDAVNRTDRTEDSALGVRLFAYDLRENPVQVTDANGNATYFEYELLGRNVERRNALGSNWTFAYDSRDNMFETVDAIGQTINKTFDALSRMTGIQLVESNGITVEDTVTFGYDARGAKMSAVGGFVTRNSLLQATPRDSFPRCPRLHTLAISSRRPSSSMLCGFTFGSA